MGKDVIIACDFAGAAETFRFLDRFTGRKPFVKIGMELFYAEGPEIVRELKRRGHRIFLDLKLHDIPNTVKKTMAVLSSLDVDIVNLHAGGTAPMMKAALEGLNRPDGTRPLLIAVTMLTSTDQQTMENDLLIREPIADVVLHYAKNAKAAGLKVGVYWYSEENGPACARQNAEYLYRVLDGRELDFPVFFDWEDFAWFETYKMSLRDFREMFYAFREEAEARGYRAALYSSKYYLGLFWPETAEGGSVWLAHYVDETTYTGDYFLWQQGIGRIDGIGGDVDFDVLYPERLKAAS